MVEVLRSRAVALGMLAALLVFAPACTDAPTSPTPTASYSQTDLRVGTGSDATVGASLTVNYTGWLYDPTRPDQKGILFDTSVGKTPFSFTLGAGQVISGWEQGVTGMKVGGIRRLIVPPTLGYGASRAGAIPPYATMVFEIELLSIP